jgi:hypothetical protein
MMAMLMEAHQTTECIFEVPAGWEDKTRYFYRRGNLLANAQELGPAAKAREQMAQGLARLRVAMPGYELVERAAIDRPAKGAELIAQRFGGRNAFEISVFWPIGEVLWMFRVQGPPSSEDDCREVLESFLQSYEPLEAK